jgi:methylthioribose-1-phosphate isomerase
VQDDDFSPIRVRDGRLALLDQTRLPAEEAWLDCPDVETVADAIRRLAVRGAPAIGVAAAWGLVVAVDAGSADEGGDATTGTSGTPTEMADLAVLRSRFDAAWELLAGTRPTAVNLRWALERGRRVWEDALPRGTAAARAALRAWAAALQAADVAANRRLGEHGAALFAAGDRALTHCNAGALATAGYGTAIGVLTSAWRGGRLSQVWVDETRPLLQGARLTAWELGRLGIPYRLVTDNSAGALLARGLVDRIVVGADRIARNGDTANKVGTYPLAVLAQRHGVPFYVAAPLSTIDLATPDGAAAAATLRREPVAGHRRGARRRDLAGRALSPRNSPGKASDAAAAAHGSCAARREE